MKETSRENIEYLIELNKSYGRAGYYLCQTSSGFGLGRQTFEQGRIRSSLRPDGAL